MSFREWAGNISARREAAKQAKIDAKAEAARRQAGIEAGKHRAGLREKYTAETAEALAGARGEIEQVGGGELGATIVGKTIVGENRVGNVDDWAEAVRKFDKETGDKKSAAGKN